MGEHLETGQQPPRRATLVASLTEVPSPGTLGRLSATADWLEVRADLVGALDAAALRSSFPGRLLFTLRSRAEGGAFEGSTTERAALLSAAAASGYDAVDLEAERDLVATVTGAVPPDRRVISWHGEPATTLELLDLLEAMSRYRALAYKLVPGASTAGEELAPLQLLAAARRPDVVAFASGGIGSWTRLIAPRLGLPWIFASAEGSPAAPGQLALSALRRDYGLPELPPVEALFGIAGHPVSHSLSPRLHNAAYRALGLPYLYLPFEVPSFGDFWLEIVEATSLAEMGFPLRGLSATSPHKEAALGVAGASSPLADRVGGANTLVVRDGVWEADTTDVAGVIEALRAEGTDPAGRRAAVLGAGGAGRAAAAALELAGADVTLVNRNAERGEESARRLGVGFLAWERFDAADFDLVVQATSLGRAEHDPLPFDIARLRPSAEVLDLVYAEEPGGRTPLVVACRERGVSAIGGLRVLLEQARAQFERMTGVAWPPSCGAAELDLEHDVERLGRRPEGDAS